MRAGDPKAREELILRHLPLARALAARYRRPTAPIDDLSQVAMLALVNAVDRWDPDRGVKFAAYAAPTIVGELKHYFRDHTWGLRPPRELQDLSRAVERARDVLQTELGRTPTLADVARRLDRSEDAVIESVQAGAGRWLDSLDAPIDAIACSDPELERAEQRVTIDQLTGILDDRAQEILRLRFEENLRQAEIAARLGLTQMRVSRVLQASLERLHALAAGSMRVRPAA